MSVFEESATVHSATAPDFYTWTFPGAPLRIHLQLSVVSPMAHEVNRAFEANATHGVEIGGLLLGTALVSRSIIEIKGFEPFPSEYWSDHKFDLSDSGRRALERQLVVRRADRSDGLGVVGFYRSHLGEVLSLNQTDVSLAQEYFNNPANVFLLVKPATNGPANAGFFFWEMGRINPEFTYLEFPFDARQLSREQPEQVRPEPLDDEGYENPEAANDFSASHLSSGDVAFERSAPRSRTHWMIFLIFGTVLIAAGAAGLGTFMKWSAQATARDVAAAPPALSLQVERVGLDLRVIWDRHSFAVARAKEGTLVIRDGDSPEQQIPLDLEQLRHGSVVYSAANPTVNFRLEITDAENVKTSQTVLALTAPRLAASGSAPDSGAVSADQRAPGNRQPQADPTARSQEPPPTPSSSRDFSEPVGAVSKRVPESSQPKLTPPLAQPNMAGAPYIRPLPIREVRPKLSPNASMEIKSLMEVEIRVHIDDKGRVVKAEPLPAKGRVSDSLVNAARKAALHWRFEPAWVGSRPVASELVLKFQYRPAAP
jgi:hypothetical protein